MQKYISLSALLAIVIFMASPVMAMEVPDLHLQMEATEARDATLTIPNNNGNATPKGSSLEVFVDTLLGKNIGSLPVKEQKE